MTEGNKKVHFIAIGGSVMHNLAIALKNSDWEVSGSDDEIFEPSKSRLEKNGLFPEKSGWDENNISSDLDLVVLGMHAKEDNPELQKAKSLGLEIKSFPEFVREFSEDKQRIVIGGSHGKTTVTAMLMHVLKALGKKFDYVVGAEVKGFEDSVQLTDDAPIIIIEGDEYLNSTLDPRPKLLLYDQHIGVITGVKWDHYNVFNNLDAYVNVFESFAENSPKAGTLIYNGDDDIAMVIGRKERIDVKAVEYNTHPYVIRDGKTYIQTKNSGEMEIPLFGEHNLNNLNAAKKVCEEMNITENDFYGAIKSFEGAGKRMELIYKKNGFSVYKDFAHAPSKLKASTSALKAQFPSKKLIACIELHTYSSLNKGFLNQYAGTYDAPDLALIYFNPEVVEQKKLEQIDEKVLKDAFKRNDLVVFNDSDELKAFIEKHAEDNGNLLMMSSGNFDGINLEQFAKTLVK